jgi:hypothetical protein
VVREEGRDVLRRGGLVGGLVFVRIEGGAAEGVGVWKDRLRSEVGVLSSIMAAEEGWEDWDCDWWAASWRAWSCACWVRIIWRRRFCRK